MDTSNEGDEQQKHEKTDGDQNSSKSSNNSDANMSFRTVYVAPIKPAIRNKVHNYFKMYGDIESIRFRSRGSFRYGLVQFKRSIDARAAAAYTNHFIENFAMVVKMADNCRQPDYSEQPLENWLQPAEEGSQSHILVALDDDVLQEVFNRLPLLDLTSVAAVCKHFNQEAKKTFNSKFKHLELHFDSNFTGRPEILESMFANFGTSIQSLTVNLSASESKDFLVQLIKQYCVEIVASNLKALKLICFEDASDDLSSLFVSLEKLVLDTCTMVNPIGDCKELRVLLLDSCIDCAGCIGNQFQNLQEAYLISNHGISDLALQCFITLNPTLVKLKIANNLISCTTKTLSLVGRIMTNLEELEFDEKFESLANFQSDVLSLGQLKSLKVLKLNFNSQSIVPLVDTLSANDIPIECFKVFKGHLDATAIESISNLKHLKELELCDSNGLTEERLVQLAKGVPQLHKLHLETTEDNIIGLTTIGLKKMLKILNRLAFLKLISMSDITIDVDDYRVMLKSVHDRPERISLRIELTSMDGAKVNVPETVLAENRDTFFIDETIEEREVISNDSENEFDDEEEYDEVDDIDDWDGVDDFDVDSEEGYDLAVMDDGRRFYLG